MKYNKIILRRWHYANKQNNILLFMIFSTPAIKARFPFDILVRNVIYQKRMKIPWNTHFSSTNSFILRSTICFAFCHCFKVSATPSTMIDFYEACFIGLSIEQCKKRMLVHDWNIKILLIDQIYLAQI